MSEYRIVEGIGRFWNKEFTEALTGILEQEPSGDLISRSELIKFFKEHIRTAKDFREIIINIIPAIENQPTAYDIDKVVAELNELDATAIRRYEGGTFGNYEGTDYYIEKNKAIEIVKQGGYK